MLARSEGNMPFAQRCVSIEKFSCFSFLLFQEPSHFVIMSSITLVLCAAVFYVQFSSCVGTTPNADTKTLCEYKEIQKCNHKFKQVFLNAKNSYGPRRPGIYARNRIYCKALQVRCGSRSWSLGKNCTWGPDHTTPGKVLVPFATLEKFKTVIGHFGFVLEQNSGREIIRLS